MEGLGRRCEAKNPIIYYRLFPVLTKMLLIPPETDIVTTMSSYKNGILEITFKKKEQAKEKGKAIKIE